MTSEGKPLPVTSTQALVIGCWLPSGSFTWTLVRSSGGTSWFWLQHKTLQDLGSVGLINRDQPIIFFDGKIGIKINYILPTYLIHALFREVRFREV